ncbi:MAG: TIGR02186 family protein, partial [Alphaproteobacteria bacterium]|nr:TIGR02186 family protein [Alphaproteobacteria bacterium]
TLNLPSNVPIGLYMIQTFLMRDGKVIDVKETSVKVAQVGVNSRIYRFAHGHSLAYGMLCVIFAMMMGWLSNIVRRR